MPKNITAGKVLVPNAAHVRIARCDQTCLVEDTMERTTERIATENTHSITTCPLPREVGAAGEFSVCVTGNEQVVFDAAFVDGEAGKREHKTAT